jgi:hypothetical protein
MPSLPRLPQFSDQYEGNKLRAMVDTLENTFSGIGRVFSFMQKGAYQLTSNLTQVGNIGTGEDNLITYSLPANTLKKEGYNLQILCWGTFAANANNKRIRAYLGSTAFFDSTALAINGGSWSLAITIVRVTDTHQQTIVRYSSSNGTFGNGTIVNTSVTATLSTDLIIKCTGEATTTNDIVQNGLTISVYPQET